VQESQNFNSTFKKIFRNGSRTYFFSSLFFPPPIRKEVTILYSFVRVADNFVDSIPADEHGFYEFKNLTLNSLDSGELTSNIIIDTFLDLAKKRGFAKSWIMAFLDSMAADLTKKRYDTLSELEDYIFGSAEVVGLMMCQILGIPAKAHHYACHLGKAMQYINFLRDIREDLELGRQYLPTAELIKFNLKELSPSLTATHYEEFKAFFKTQVELYLEWQSVAEEGYRYIPQKYLIPIRTAAEMYRWTAKKLAERPELVFIRKVKPSKARIIYSGSKYALSTKYQ
jgi:15-cis-phytoene synthase